MSFGTASLVRLVLYAEALVVKDVNFHGVPLRFELETRPTTDEPNWVRHEKAHILTLPIRKSLANDVALDYINSSLRRPTRKDVTQPESAWHVHYYKPRVFGKLFISALAEEEARKNKPKAKLSQKKALAEGEDASSKRKREKAFKASELIINLFSVKLVQEWKDLCPDLDEWQDARFLTFWRAAEANVHKKEEKKLLRKEKTSGATASAAAPSRDDNNGEAAAAAQDPSVAETESVMTTDAPPTTIEKPLPPHVPITVVVSNQKTMDAWLTSNNNNTTTSKTLPVAAAHPPPPAAAAKKQRANIPSKMPRTIYPTNDSASSSDNDSEGEEEPAPPANVVLRQSIGGKTLLVPPSALPYHMDEDDDPPFPPPLPPPSKVHTPFAIKVTGASQPKKQSKLTASSSAVTFPPAAVVVPETPTVVTVAAATTPSSSSSSSKKRQRATIALSTNDASDDEAYYEPPNPKRVAAAAAAATAAIVVATPLNWPAKDRREMAALFATHADLSNEMRKRILASIPNGE